MPEYTTIPDIIIPGKGIIKPSPLAKRGESLGRLPRVLVATLFYDNTRNVYEETKFSMLKGKDSLFYADEMRICTSAVDMGRNSAIDYAIENKYDFVFFADSDMGFPGGCLAQLVTTMTHLNSDTRPYIVAGVYNLRRSGFELAVYRKSKEMYGFESINSVTDPEFDLDGSVYRADAAGTGCMLIRLALFEDYNIKFPYFQYWYRPMIKGGKIHRWSEDLVFCHKCFEEGVSIFVDTSVVCKHELRDCTVMQVDGSRWEIQVNDDFKFNLHEIEK